VARCVWPGTTASDKNLADVLEDQWVTLYQVLAGCVDKLAMSGQPEEQPKYSPNESMTPGYSWRSSNIPKRITHAHPTFIPASASRRSPLGMILVACLVIGAVAYAGHKYPKEIRKALKPVMTMLR